MRERKIELLAISQICQIFHPQTFVLYGSYITFIICIITLQLASVCWWYYFSRFIDFLIPCSSFFVKRQVK